MNKTLRSSFFLLALFLLAYAKSNGQCSGLKARGHGYPGRCFTLNVYNVFNVPITFKINPSACYEGEVITQSPLIQPQCGYPITLCRVQGHGCNGKNGEFDIEVTSPEQLIGHIFLSFTNNLELSVIGSDKIEGNLSNQQFDNINGTNFCYYDLRVSNVRSNAKANSYPDRCFTLNVYNDFNVPITFKINPSTCYEGDAVTRSPLIQPHDRYPITLCRVQGHGCDGKNGEFEIEVTSPEQFRGSHHFFFTNDNGLWDCGLKSNPGSTPTIDGRLSERKSTKLNGTVFTYYDFKLTNVPEPPPFSNADLNPINKVANSYCDWKPNGGSPIKLYQFANSRCSWGNFYDDCVGYELWHNQHIVRLPNKADKDGNERAYFMVAQSRDHNGYIELLETNPGVLDPATDQINASDNSFVGNIIWNDVYTGSFNGDINPIGNWNHPGKMDVCGGFLVVAAQNWEPSTLKSFACGVHKGDSPEAVLFYDVRDPQYPKFLGKITIGELGLTGGEISSVALIRAPNGDYILNVGGNNSWGTYYAKDQKIGWTIGDWEKINNDGLTGQHGMNFMSLSCDNPPSEKMIYFDTQDMNSFSFTEYDYDATRHQFIPGGKSTRFPVSASYRNTLPGADRDWDADGLYVSKFGVPIIYTAKSLKGTTIQIYQVTTR